MQVRSELTKVKVIAWQIKFRFNLDHHGHLSVCKISFFTSKNLSILLPCPMKEKHCRLNIPVLHNYKVVFDLKVISDGTD